MKLGLVGLPNVGKSTLFNAITKAGAHVANYPFATIDPNVGIVHVPDHRLDVLAAMYRPEKVTPAILEVVDIAGLVAGASHGEGLGNAFLANIREVDAIGHVVRCFDDGNVTHVSGTIDPAADIEVVELELILSDLAYIGRRLEKTARAAKSGDPALKEEVRFLEELETHLSASKPARTFADGGREWPQDLFLLTSKPLLYIANVAEDDIGGQSPHVAAVKTVAAAEHAPVIVIAAKIEAEMAELDDSERADFEQALGLQESGLDRLAAEAYRLLNQISYLTAGPKEVRAWTISKGTKAPQAAGKIHTDFERGFIRAEVIAYADLIEAGTMAHAKELGKVRSEGKEYVFRDGDVVLFRFNV